MVPTMDSRKAFAERLHLAHAVVDGQDVEHALIAAGAAWCCVRYLPRDSDCPQREAVARADHRGVWSTPDPVPPWDWRKSARTVEK